METILEGEYEGGNAEWKAYADSRPVKERVTGEEFFVESKKRQQQVNEEYERSQGISNSPPPQVENENPPVIEPIPSVEPPPTHDELPPITMTEAKPSHTLLLLLCGLAMLGLCAVVYVMLKKRK